LHIVAAIISVGFNFSYIVWLRKGKLENEHLLFALKGIKLMDDWLANPSYILSLFSGLAMCYLNGIDLLTINWVSTSLFLFACLGIVGYGFYTPILSKQIRILKAEGSDSVSYRAIDKKQTMVGVLLFSLSLTILFMMVTKPSM